MGSSRFRRSLTSWIATFAILMAALAPTATQFIGVAHGQMAGWIEVCSDQGTHLVAMRLDPSGSDESGDSCKDLCPYCFTHAGSFGLALSGSSQAPFDDGAFPPFLHVQQAAPRSTDVWPGHQTRAPPTRA
jgi:hypothetical protein